MNRTLRIGLACLGLPLVLAFSNCSDGLESTPTNPSGSASGGGATPTPTPTATPTPAPTATPTALKCELSERPDCGASCCFEGGGNPYVGVINDAQANLERTRPDLFNSNGSLAVDEVTYTRILAEKITAMSGVCAIGGGEGSSRSKDEVGLKRDNNSSTNVDVIIGSTHSPAILGVYTCRPAAF